MKDNFNCTPISLEKILNEINSLYAEHTPQKMVVFNKGNPCRHDKIALFLYDNFSCASTKEDIPYANKMS